MTEMFSLLKELTKEKSPEKVLVREEVSNPVTNYVNPISLVRMENDKGKERDEVVEENIVEPIQLVDKEEAMDDEKDNESYGSKNKDSTRWDKLMIPRSQPIGYYLKHKINEKTIESLVDNHRYNDSLLATHLDGKMSKLAMENHFGCMLTTKMRVRGIMIMGIYGCIPINLNECECRENVHGRDEKMVRFGLLFISKNITIPWFPRYPPKGYWLV
ncbi:hypothetical protein Tco_1086698 [Tanacetum coccineum]